MKRATTKAFSYKQEMWRHLADYKVSALGIRLDGIWRKNRREYAHILPFGYQHLNILEPYREEFWKFFRRSAITLHSDFHHLSSSQAMCFNLFFPFLAEGKKHLEILHKVFSTDEPIKDGRFEVVLDPAEGTNFDFCIATAKSKKLFEIKLTEHDFGNAKADASHLSKFQTVYLPAMDGKFSPGFCSCNVFLKHYQLMRNIWNLDVGTRDTLVCVVPRANNCLRREIEFLKKCLSEPYRERVSVHYLEDLAATLEKAIPDDAPQMKEHFRLFGRKYFPDVEQSASVLSRE